MQPPEADSFVRMVSMVRKSLGTIQESGLRWFCWRPSVQTKLGMQELDDS